MQATALPIHSDGCRGMLAARDTTPDSNVPSGQSHVAVLFPPSTHTFTLCPLELQILEHAKYRVPSAVSETSTPGLGAASASFVAAPNMQSS
jgi:hypothetical protein